LQAAGHEEAKEQAEYDLMLTEGALEEAQASQREAEGSAAEASANLQEVQQQHALEITNLHRQLQVDNHWLLVQSTRYYAIACYGDWTCAHFERGGQHWEGRGVSMSGKRRTIIVATPPPPGGLIATPITSCNSLLPLLVMILYPSPLCTCS